uniref:peroxisomal membrane protein 11A isoform X2 n=1 Tax=Agelaius phoeniceus TaxID=39638 RepID=UPI0023EB1CCC|nr:peroxisomal membrane protein 11A isoform X2 [Agelaius phoeniceus]
MEGFVSFTNRCQGRDQLFRATQYTCMLLSYLIENKADKKKLVMKLKQLESSMSSGRKSNRALYFVCDAALWLRSVGLQPNLDKPKWHTWATKCYYCSLLMNLARDWYEISWRLEQAALEEKAKENSVWQEDGKELNGVKSDGLHGFLCQLFQILKRNPPLLLDLVKNLCDLSGPLDTLGIYKTNPGVIGFCGVLSSLVGILTLASPHLKLKQ